VIQDGNMSPDERLRSAQEGYCVPRIQAMMELLSMSDEQLEAWKKGLTGPPTNENT
jgi:hypothetical protein